MAEGQIEARLGVTDIISKVEALSRVARGAHGSTVKLNSALSGLDKVRAEGLDKALDSVFAMIDSIKELEQQIDKLSGKQLSVGLDNKEKKRLTELTGIAQAKHGIDKRASKDKKLPSKLGDAQKKLIDAMGGEEGKQLEFLDKLLVARKDLIKAENEHQQIQKFNKTSTGKFEEFIKRQVSAIKARIAAGKELTEVQKRFLKLVQDKALAGKDMGKLGGSAQALALSELTKATRKQAAEERAASDEKKKSEKEELDRVERLRDNRRRQFDELKRDTIWRIKHDKQLTDQQQRLVNVTKKMNEQNRVRARFRDVAAAVMAKEKQEARKPSEEAKNLERIEKERAARKAAFEEMKADAIWRIRNNKELTDQQKRLIAVTDKMIEQNRVRRAFRPVASAILTAEKRLSNQRNKDAPQEEKQSKDRERREREIVRVIKEKIRASDQLTNAEIKLIKQTQKMISEQKQLLPLQRRLASSLRLASSELEINGNRVSATSKHVTTLKNAYERLQLVISRARNALLLWTFAVRPVIRSLRAVVDSTIEYEKATTGLTTVAGKFGVRTHQVHQAIQLLTNDGLMKVSEASKGLRNLLSTGIGMDKAIETMMALKDAAAFNRQGMLEYGQAVVGATDGIKNMISRMVDNAGITKNISIILEEQAKKYGKVVSQLSEVEKHLLIVEGVIEESRMFSGDAARLTDTLAGSFDKLTFAVDAFTRTLGNAIESNTGMFSGFAKTVTAMAEALTQAIERADASPTMRQVLAARKVGASGNILSAMDQDFTTTSNAHLIKEIGERQTALRQHLQEFADAWGPNAKPDHSWNVISKAFEMKRRGFLAPGMNETSAMLVGMGRDDTESLEFARHVTSFGRQLEQLWSDTMPMMQDPEDRRQLEHNTATAALNSLKDHVDRHKQRLVKEAETVWAENVFRKKHGEDPIEGLTFADVQKRFEKINEFVGPFIANLEKIKRETKEIKNELAEAQAKADAANKDAIHKQATSSQRILDRITREVTGKEGDIFERRAEVAKQKFKELEQEVKRLMIERFTLDGQEFPRLTEDAGNALLSEINKARELRIDQIAKDRIDKQRKDADKLVKNMARGATGAEPDQFQRRIDAVEVRGKEMLESMLLLPENIRASVGLTEDAVADWVLAIKDRIENERLEDLADKEAREFITAFNQRIRREQKEKSIRLSELAIGDTQGKLRAEFWEKLMGSEEKKAIDLWWENTQQMIQEKLSGIEKIENLSAVTRKEEIDKIDTERLTAKEKYYKDLLRLFKEFLKEQQKIDKEEVSALERVEDGLGDVSRAFGNVASAARFAGDAGIDGLDSIAKKGQLVAQSLSQAAGGVRQLQAIEELGGMGSIAGSMSAVGGIAAIAGAGFMAYSAWKGPGEGEKARSRFNRTGDLGASISRGPNTININPSIVVQAEGDVLFSQDSIDVFRTRLVEEMQQAIDNNEISVEGY